MPSFTKLALALLALSASVIANTVSPAGGEVFSDLAKRAPAKSCRRNNQCRTKIPFAVAVCNNRGRCDFACRKGYQKKNGRCSAPPQPKYCRYNSNCSTKVANATPACSNSKCTFKCKTNFHPEGGKCVANAHLCGGKSCPKVSNGYAICRGNKWVPQSHFNLGFKLFRNGNAYVCINVRNDANNCGRINRRCPAGYNGLGNKTCSNGVCGLDCRGLKTRTLPNGRKYCSKR